MKRGQLQSTHAWPVSVSATSPSARAVKPRAASHSESSPAPTRSNAIRRRRAAIVGAGSCQHAGAGWRTTVGQLRQVTFGAPTIG